MGHFTHETLMWTWIQSSGEMIDAGGEVVGLGYSGAYPEGLNNPSIQTIHDQGPIPQGRYEIGPLLSSYVAGNVVLEWCSKLTPDPANEMFGRSGFLIHGRNSLTDLRASEGCIVLDHEPRMRILESADRLLEVTS